MWWNYMLSCLCSVFNLSIMSNCEPFERYRTIWCVVKLETLKIKYIFIMDFGSWIMYWFPGIHGLKVEIDCEHVIDLTCYIHLFVLASNRKHEWLNFSMCFHNIYTLFCLKRWNFIFCVFNKDQVIKIMWTNMWNSGSCTISCLAIKPT